MSPEQARAVWERMNAASPEIMAASNPMAVVGAAVTLAGMYDQELFDEELVQSARTLGFDVTFSTEDVTALRVALTIAREIANEGAPAQADETFEPFQISFYQNENGEIEAIVSIGDVTFPPHVLDMEDARFARDYQRVARECRDAGLGKPRE